MQARGFTYDLTFLYICIRRSLAQDRLSRFPYTTNLLHNPYSGCCITSCRPKIYSYFSSCIYPLNFEFKLLQSKETHSHAVSAIALRFNCDEQTISMYMAYIRTVGFPEQNDKLVIRWAYTTICCWNVRWREQARIMLLGNCANERGG